MVFCKTFILKNFETFSEKQVTLSKFWDATFGYSRFSFLECSNFFSDFFFSDDSFQISFLNASREDPKFISNISDSQQFYRFQNDTLREKCPNGH